MKAYSPGAKSPTTISLCMIVKDEEEVLANCLESVKNLVDEIIIVDTGSKDQTKEIARRYTDKIWDFEWIDDFSAARNFAFSKAKMDYILWLDADDVLLEDDQEKFLKLKKDGSLPSYDAVSMIYNIAFDEYGNPTFSYRRYRLVKRSRNFKWHGPVHEYLEVGGNIFKSDIAVTHRKSVKTKTGPADRNLRIYESRLQKGESFSPRDLYYYANELKDHGQYEKAIQYYQKFLDTNQGWIEDVIGACGRIGECYARLGNKEKEIEAVLNSFKYDRPRPEHCCKIGDYFISKKNYQAAAVWFNLAVNYTPNDSGGFHKPSYSTWYPHLQLCVCYWHLGDPEKSQYHNEEAAKYRPDDPAVEFNRNFFKKHLKR